MADGKPGARANSRGVKEPGKDSVDQVRAHGRDRATAPTGENTALLSGEKSGLGVAEGQEVEVQVKVITKVARTPGEGFLRTEGALADDTEWDSIMEEIHQERKRGMP